MGVGRRGRIFIDLRPNFSGREPRGQHAEAAVRVATTARTRFRSRIQGGGACRLGRAPASWPLSIQRLAAALPLFRAATNPAVIAPDPDLFPDRGMLAFQGAAASARTLASRLPAKPYEPRLWAPLPLSSTRRWSRRTGGRLMRAHDGRRGRRAVTALERCNLWSTTVAAGAWDREMPTLPLKGHVKRCAQVAAPRGDGAMISVAARRPLSDSWGHADGALGVAGPSLDGHAPASLGRRLLWSSSRAAPAPTGPLLRRHRHRRLGAPRDDHSPGMRSSRSWRGWAETHR